MTVVRSEDAGRGRFQDRVQLVVLELGGSFGWETGRVPAVPGEDPLHVERSLLKGVRLIEPFSQDRLFAGIGDHEPVAVGVATDFVPQPSCPSFEEPDHH